jgi:hypothetical protein
MLELAWSSGRCHNAYGLSTGRVGERGALEEWEKETWEREEAGRGENDDSLTIGSHLSREK